MRDDCRTLSTRETDSSDERPETPIDGGVLAALPRTRPQRASARRAAARQRAGDAKSETAVKTTPAKVKTKTKAKAVKPKTAPAKVKPSSPKTKAKPTAPKKPLEPPGGRAPNQGYEPEEEIELGKTVNPPSGVELVESVADIFGELANSGLAAGGRILKDAFSLLRRP